MKNKPCPPKPLAGGREICRTPRQWLNRRLELVERAEGRCEGERNATRCNRWTPLWAGNAHHKNGTRGLGGGKRDDSLDNLLWLCEDCHSDEHERIRRAGIGELATTTVQ